MGASNRNFAVYRKTKYWQEEELRVPVSCTIGGSWFGYAQPLQRQVRTLRYLASRKDSTGVSGKKRQIYFSLFAKVPVRRAHPQMLDNLVNFALGARRVLFLVQQEGVAYALLVNCCSLRLCLCLLVVASSSPHSHHHHYIAIKACSL